eukprot:107155-Chlamydomonas_euryale.AAC.1
MDHSTATSSSPRADVRPSVRCRGYHVPGGPPAPSSASASISDVAARRTGLLPPAAAAPLPAAWPATAAAAAFCACSTRCLISVFPSPISMTPSLVSDTWLMPTSWTRCTSRRCAGRQKAGSLVSGKGDTHRRLQSRGQGRGGGGWQAIHATGLVGQAENASRRSAQDWTAGWVAASLDGQHQTVREQRSADA